MIEEEEQFTELASNEFLLKQLRELLASGAREALDEIPDGIHSGLARPGAKGVFFYFQGRPQNREKLHFWKYVDLKNCEQSGIPRTDQAAPSPFPLPPVTLTSPLPQQSGRGTGRSGGGAEARGNDRRAANGIIDNRYLIANLISCDRDTPRVVKPELLSTVFDLQEKVVTNILSSIEEQKARESVPRVLDPVQQTVATAIQGYLSHPDVDRTGAVEAIRFVSQPMRRTQVTRLRQAFKEFQRTGAIRTLLEAITEIRSQFGEQSGVLPPLNQKPAPVLSRDNLRLICFDLISG
ncbi:MAG: hypothetical protein JO071_08625 [Deltaproteobacteria bacterium]|nr:hypothetical protein [Deltaproteobacteria bacterium]